jgi:hypothetical protein
MLLLHARAFSFRALKPAVRDPPDPPSSGSCSNCLVALVSVEAGDGPATVRGACDEVESWARKIGVSTVLVYPYAHLSKSLASVGEAHEALMGISKCLEDRGLDAGRAPLGWYKEFTLELQGHPLAEAFREIAGAPLAVRARGEIIALEEAARRGLIDPHWLGEDVDRRAVEVMERLCMGPGGGSLLREYTVKLEAWLAGRAGLDTSDVPRETLYLPPGLEPRSLQFLVKSCGLALARGAPLVVEGCAAGESVVALKGDLDTQGLLEELIQGITGGLREVYLEKGEVSLTSTLGVRGKLVGYGLEKSVLPLALEAEGDGGRLTCIGPMGSLLRSLISSELSKASKGESSPLIPAWLHPFQAAIIPVTEGEVEYSRALARRLVSLGAGVLLLASTSEKLGARIRYAAMRWIPYIAVVGRKEAETGTVSVRRRWRPGEQEVISADSLVEELAKTLSGAPIRVPRLKTVAGKPAPQKC